MAGLKASEGFGFTLDARGGTRTPDTRIMNSPGDLRGVPAGQ